MKCYSRTTFGVIIGTINILFYVGIGVAMIFIYLDSWQNKSVKIKILDGLVISVCFIMVLVSGLLIFGIVKKLPKLIWPWLVLTAVSLLCNAGRAIAALILGIIDENPFQTLIFTLAIDVLAVLVQALIFWPIYTLCRDISQKNNNEQLRTI